MFDYDKTYMIESEIDKAFPYLDKLNEEINIAKKLEANKTNEKYKFDFFRIFKSNKKNEIEKENIIGKNTKYLKSKNYKKDGYEFRIKLNMKYDDSQLKSCYYEFFVNIKYAEEKRKKEFYKVFFNKEDAKKYYSNWEGIMKNLTRRDIMEKLFHEKINELENYKRRKSSQI